MNLKNKALIFFIFIFLSFTAIPEEYKIMSFNIQYGNTKATHLNDSWYNYFTGIVSEVNPDILLVQEIGEANNGIEKVHKALGQSTYGCISTEKYFAHKSYINNGTTYSGFGGSTQNNVVFYKNRKFKAEDLCEKLKFTTPEHTRFPSDFNNFQCIKFTTKDNKTFIVVNAHVRPDGKDFWKMKEGIIHSRDTITLRKLLYEMEKLHPTAGVIAGGDFNYSRAVLTDTWTDGQKLSAEWTVDPGFTPDEYSQAGLGTTYSNGPWDHFICNDLIRVTRDFCIPLKLNSDSKDSYTYVNGKWMKDSEFNRNISDHWPVSISIKY